MRKVEYLTKNGFTTSYAKAKELGTVVPVLSEVKKEVKYFKDKPMIVRMREKGLQV